MHSGRLGEQLLVAFGVEAVRLEGKPGARDRTDAFDKTRQLSKEIGVGHRKSSPPKYSTPPRPDLWASTQREPSFLNLSLSEERFGKALAPFLVTTPFMSFSSQRDSHETHTQPQGLRLGARRMPESNPRRPTMLSPDSRYGIADPLQKDLFQRLEHRADRRRPDPWPSHTQRWRASRSRLAPRFAPARRALASNLRPGRCRAAPSRKSSDKSGGPVSFLRMFSERGAGWRQVPLRPRRAEASRDLRLAAGRQKRASERRTRRRNPVGAHTSASHAARSLQKQYAISRERPALVRRHQREGRRNVQAPRTGLDTVANRAIRELFNVEAAAMVRAARAPSPLLSLEGQPLDELRNFDAGTVCLSRPGICARSRALSRSARLVAFYLP